MNERPEDLDELQIVLDRSYEAAGAHLRDVTTPVIRVM